MEAEKGRDWQSMRNHFRRSIIKNIDSYGLISEQVDFFKKKTIIKDAQCVSFVHPL